MAPFFRRHHANGRRFHKFIVDPRDHRLRIPTDFRQKYGHYLPNCVLINIPDGTQWEIELVHSDGEIWLQKGFWEFKEYYSIGFGHLLVFEYDGKSYFDVLIFDTTSSEIEYETFDSSHETGVNVDKGVPKRDRIGSESDDSVEILDEFKKYEGKYVDENSHKEFSIPLTSWEKKRKWPRVDDDHPMRKTVQGMQNQSSHWKNNPRLVISSPNYQPQYIRKKLKKPVNRQTSIPYQKAKTFQADNPSEDPSFIVLMQASYVLHPFVLTVPVSFARENLPSNQNEIKLSVSDHVKVWPMKYNFHKKNSWIACGWREFLHDNALKVGDACLFYINKDNRLAWHVNIFRR